jgi:hypothetical protein
MLFFRVIHSGFGLTQRQKQAGILAGKIKKEQKFLLFLPACG